MIYPFSENFSRSKGLQLRPRSVGCWTLAPPTPPRSSRWTASSQPTSWNSSLLTLRTTLTVPHRDHLIVVSTSRSPSTVPFDLPLPKGPSPYRPFPGHHPVPYCVLSLVSSGRGPVPPFHTFPSSTPPSRVWNFRLSSLISTDRTGTLIVLWCLTKIPPFTVFV